MMKRRGKRLGQRLPFTSVGVPPSLPLPHFSLCSSKVPDASLSWHSYRASEAATGRETMKREERFTEGEMASWLQAMDRTLQEEAACIQWTTLVREGHETCADIILCLPPVPNNWGSGLKDPSFVWCVICHLPLEM